MKATARWAAAGGVVFLLVVTAEAQKPRSAFQDVDGLADDLAVGRGIADAAKALAARHELAGIMRVYLRDVRVPPGQPGRDAAPALLFGRLTDKELTKAAVANERNKLLALARASRVISLLASHHTPAKPTAGLGLREWKALADDLWKGAVDLEQAARDGDAAGVNTAARRMRNACANCHADFDAAARVLPAPGKVNTGGVKSVVRLAKLIGEGKRDSADLAVEARAIRRGNDELNDIMLAFKPKDKGGAGYGKMGEGIELKVIGLGKRALPAATLTKEKDDLIKLANLTLAVAEVTAHYAPAKPRGGRGKKDWDRHVADLKTGAKALRQAARDGKAAALKSAANVMTNACNNCHTDFRDN